MNLGLLLGKRRAWVLGLVLFSGCNVPPQLKKSLGFDLSHTVGFGITAPPSSSTKQGLEAASTRQALGGAMPGQGSQIVAIADDGTTTVLNPTDNKTAELTPFWVFPSPEMVAFAYGSPPSLGEDACDLVVVRLADSAAYCVPFGFGQSSAGGVTIPSGHVLFNSAPDGFVLEGGGTVARVSLEASRGVLKVVAGVPLSRACNGGVCRLAQASMTSERAEQVVSNSSGELLTNVSPPGQGARVYRVIRPDDTFEQLVGSFAVATAGLPSAPDDFFAVSQNPLGLKRISKKGGTWAVTDLQSAGHPLDPASLSGGGLGGELMPLVLSGREFLLLFSGAGSGRALTSIIEVLPDGSVMVSPVAQPGAGPSWAFVRGSGVLRASLSTVDASFKVEQLDVLTQQSTTLLVTQAYSSVSALAVGAAGDISFAATRLRDSRSLLVSVAAGSMTPVEVELPSTTPEVIFLQRVR